ncbi:MAG: methanogenesis marker protein 11 [Halobacteriota archaeon]|nr:methanogenesis marker protein 11 [Halobacteriota archaeon]
MIQTKPWVAPYQDILAICDEEEGRVELIEESNCYGGAAWARHHFVSSSSLIIESRTIGNTTRHLLNVGRSELNLVPTFSAAGIESVIVNDRTVEVTYAGLGGGGVGATACRALAEDVISYEMTEAGGSRLSRGTITLPRRRRVIIGVDDTDTKEEGATWSLVHNIACKVQSRKARYISHSIVQLHPVKIKTQNCVATVVEFACIEEHEIIRDFKRLLSELTLSEETGMAVLQSFDAGLLEGFAKRCKEREVSKKDAIEASNDNYVKILMEGQGIIGAIASIPYFARPVDSVKL